ncbi:MAG: DNA-binding response OmpR family regulator [Myxococcota bacterium]
MPRVLIVDDNQTLACRDVDFLHSAHFTTDVATTVDDVPRRVLTNPPDAIVLSADLPPGQAIHLCQRIRGDFSGPILVVTETPHATVEVAAFEAGADDYVRRPKDNLRLALRLHAACRRNRFVPTISGYIDAELEVNPTRRHVRVHGTPVQVTSAQFDVLHMLAQHAGRPLPRDVYYRATTGAPYNGTDRTLDIHLSHLRNTLVRAGLSRLRLSTVRGIGYQLNML